MALKEYRRKRDFKRTPEPPGTKVPKGTRYQYVIQKHAASRLHYDFRLEWDGTLKSWAVPKGPSLVPGEKHLAVEVEDHPIEYGKFEGTIPKGQYGGGSVLLWDRGTWTPLEDPAQGFKKGRLKFRLDGEKLHGAWALVRMRGRDNEDRANWLLIKDRDEYARKPGDPGILEERPESVASGKVIEEIGGKAAATWESNRAGTSSKRAKLDKPKPAKPTREPSHNGSDRNGAPRSTGPTGKKAPFPRTIEPELATLVTRIPEGDDWLFEIKFDGYRILAFLEGRKVRLVSRNGKDWTERFAPMAAALAKLGVKSALLDGEMVVLRENGTSDFQALQNHLKRGKTDDLVYYVFDILHLDGYDLTALPLVDRKAKLQRLLAPFGDKGAVRYSDHVVGQGERVLQHACRMALEGVIAKRADAPYRPGRGKDWLKLKCIENQEFVIVGYSDPQGSRKGLGALLLGFYDKDGQLRYAGKVGTGFTEESLKDLTRRLERLESKKSPFKTPPPGVPKNVHWVKPELVAEVEFTEWTSEGHLRHPSFHGLREDKPARAVTRETREAPPEPDSDEPARKSASRASAKHSSAKLAATAPARASSRSGSGSARVGGIAISHPDRIVFPAAKITKLELAEYYVAVADRMLPHVIDRPLMILRCPEGEGHPCFFQKNAGTRVPEGLGEVAIPDEKGGPTATYLRVREAKGLVALVQMGVLEVHIWGSMAQKLEKPDRIVFDLDPDPSVPWSRVVEAAGIVREELKRHDLVSFLKTTGGKGLHVVAPIEPKLEWPEVKEFTREVTQGIVRTDSRAFTAHLSKEKRKGRIFIDYLRNGRGATWVAPYSARARPKAAVSLPIDWKELKPSLDPEAFTVRTVPGLLPGAAKDPWRAIATTQQSIPRGALSRR
jgi:bifunctional non-homologous end joining protein LigD